MCGISPNIAVNKSCMRRIYALVGSLKTLLAFVYTFARNLCLYVCHVLHLCHFDQVCNLIKQTDLFPSSPPHQKSKTFQNKTWSIIQLLKKKIPSLLLLIVFTSSIYLYLHDKYTCDNGKFSTCMGETTTTGTRWINFLRPQFCNSCCWVRWLAFYGIIKPKRWQISVLCCTFQAIL